MNEKQIVNALNHRRHDWMNDLQLILGYMQLNKLDKLNEVVQGMLVRMQQESRWSHMGNDRLVLAVFHRISTAIEFDYDIQLSDNYTFQGDDSAADRVIAWLDEQIQELTAHVTLSYNEKSKIYLKFEQLPDKWMVRVRLDDGEERIGTGQLVSGEVN